MFKTLSAALAGSAAILAIASPAQAQTRSFQVPAGNLKAALDVYARQAGRPVIYDADQVRGARSPGVSGSLSSDQALDALLAGTAFQVRRQGAAVAIVPAGNGGVSAAEPRGGAEDPRSPDAADMVASSEIVVTAQKREQRLIEVPQSISVLSSEMLENRGAVQLRDFADTVPGLSYFSSGAGYSQISMRGITTGTDISPTVAIYIDEVPFGSSSAYTAAGRLTLDPGLFGIERIEVLRGPQGTLYGASTMGGLLKFVTPEPNTQRFSGDVRAGISTTRHGGISYNAAGSLNVPIATDTAALRVGAYYSRDGGYVDNVFLGQKDVNRADTYGAKADLLLTPAEAFTVRLSGFFQNIDRDGIGSSDFAPSGNPLTSSLEQSRRIEEPFTQKFRLVSATLGYDLGPVQLTSISSYQHSRTTYAYDFSRLYIPFLQSSYGRSYSAVGFESQGRVKKFVQEVRLSAEKMGPFDWVVGGFLTDERSLNLDDTILRTPAGAPAPNDVYTLRLPSRFQEVAAFGTLTWHLTDRFEVAGGLRYAKNKQRFEQIGSGFLIASFPEQRAKDDVFTYLANARYSFSDNASLYMRYATGYRPGGPNFVTTNPTTGLPNGPAQFASDTLDSYEVGFRADTVDRTFAVDISAYYIDWSNIQVATSAGGFPFRTNAPGGATSRGAELSLTARPTPGFVVTGAFAYQDSHLSKAAPLLRAVAKERLPNVPKFTATLNADYELRDLSYRPEFGATLRFVSDRLASFRASTSLPQYRLPAYTALDLRAGITVAPVTARVFVRNLLDVRAEQSVSAYRAGHQVTVIEPRTLGLSLSTVF